MTADPDDLPRRLFEAYQHGGQLSGCRWTTPPLRWDVLPERYRNQWRHVAETIDGVKRIQDGKQTPQADGSSVHQAGA